jgi:hypothetical protein
MVFSMENRKFSTHGDTTAAKTSCLDKRICQHWFPPSRSCLLVTDGLFIPVYQHVTTYCLTSFYSSCFQYQLLAGDEDEAGQERREPINRRRSIRVPVRHTFRFSEITGHDHIPGVREDDAWTIDLSNHGIRFASRQLLPLNMAIHFFMEADDTAAEFEGNGRVVWCEPLAASPLFHAGIVLTDRPYPMLPPPHPFRDQA